MRGFLSDVYIRPSCYRCRCKNGVSHSDLTIADFWGVPVAMPDFDDDKGVGLVLVNTDKGKAVFDVLDMDVRSTTVEAAKVANGGFNEEVKAHPKRNLFFFGYQNAINIIENIHQVLKISLFKKCINKTKKLSRKIIKKTFGK